MNSDKPIDPPPILSPNRNWTRRWGELRFHSEQSRLWNDQTRFKVVPAGRRSGKTELAKRRLAEHLFRATWHGQPGRYFAAAPTRGQAKRIFWQDLKLLVPRPWRPETSESELRIRTGRGNELWVVGLDKAERVEGTPWDGCVIDELADCKPGIWDSNIRPALADRRGWAWLIGVPDMHGRGQRDYERLVDLAVGGLDAEWALYTWPSSDILPPEEIDSARRRIDSRLFQQEYEGRFVSAGGRAFPDFNVAVHVKPTAYDPALPLCWSLDFNLTPMCSGILQHRHGFVRVLDELSLADTRTDDACIHFLDRVRSAGWELRGLVVYGDATGDARDSTSGVSDWHIVRNRLRDVPELKLKIPRANPPVKDTLNAVAGRLRGADGSSLLAIDPRCTRLIEDLKSAPWPGDLEPYHAVAWLRYFVEREYPVLPGGAGAGGDGRVIVL